MGACWWQQKSGKSLPSLARASRSCMSRICGIRPGGMATYVTRVMHTSCAVNIFVTNTGHTSGKSYFGAPLGSRGMSSYVTVCRIIA